MDNPQSWLPYVLPRRESYFDPLCRKLDLHVENDGRYASYGFASATGGYLRVHFEHDRGLCYLAIGAASDDEALCSVEEMAGRFPRIRAMPGGIQRIALEEQVQFLEAYWLDLQTMFSPEHLEETKRWRKAAGAAFLRKLRGGS